MKCSALIIVVCFDCVSVPSICWGQNNFSITTPLIWSSVTVKDNWTPPTAPYYKEYLSGSAFGYGVSLNYSFQPELFIKDQRFFVNVGFGYFTEKLSIRRPFNYDTPYFLIVRTKHYSYRCWLGSLGITYSYKLSEEYLLSGSVAFNTLQSFQQEYTPNTDNNTLFPTQIIRNDINFGKMFACIVGLSRSLGGRFLIGTSLLCPVYTQWRNDVIFDDDPATFMKPDFSLGLTLSISYQLKKREP